MIREYFSKISISLAVLIIICFFLPWLSIDCGNVTVVKFSGYDLTIGNIPIDKNLMEQMSAQLGQTNQKVDVLENDKQAPPQWYLGFIVISALGFLFFGIKQLGEISRSGIIGICSLSAAGLLVMIIAVLAGFGMKIPSEAAMFISTSYLSGFYLTVIFYLVTLVLAIIALKEPSEETAVLSGQIDIEIPPVNNIDFQAGGENMFTENTLDFGAPVTPPAPPPAPAPQKKTAYQPPATPAGGKKCPACGAPVSPYQTKCIKCGSKIKSGK